MEFQELEELLYQDYKIFNQYRDLHEVEETKKTAIWVNRMAGRQVFDDEYIKSLSDRTSYSELEKYYLFMTNQLLERVPIFHKLKKSYTFYPIITDYFDIEVNVFGNDVAVAVEWPYIKYIDMLNKNILYGSDFDELQRKSEYVLEQFIHKYRDGRQIDLHENIYHNSNPVFFQLGSYLRNLQELFILGHELGHILLRQNNEANTEENADNIAFQSVVIYCRHNKKLIPYVCIAVMLLFSYLTWLETGKKKDYEAALLTVLGWRDRYDRLFDYMERYYDEMTEDEQQLVRGYDKICNLIEEVGEHICGIRNKD